jgi:uncharacterized coiled-coil protein SlyX
MDQIQERESEAKAVVDILAGVKVLVPFAVSISMITGVWIKLEGDVTTLKAAQAKQEARVDAIAAQVTAQELTLTEVKSDLKHIKDDTKETLDLVREWMRKR